MTAVANIIPIQQAINDLQEPSRAIEAWYIDEDVDNDPPRRFLAYIFGQSNTRPGTRNSVLAYQYSGLNTSNSDYENWRCFNVDEFKELLQIEFRLPKPTLSIPDPLTRDEVRRLEDPPYTSRTISCASNSSHDAS